LLSSHLAARPQEHGLRTRQRVCLHAMRIAVHGWVRPSSSLRCCGQYKTKCKYDFTGLKTLHECGCRRSDQILALGIRQLSQSRSGEWCMAADSALQADIAEFAAKRPRPVSLQEILSNLDLRGLAKFIHGEVPVRYAERIRWIEDIPDWAHISEFADVHDRHVQTFRDLRRTSRYPTLNRFTTAVQDAEERTRDVPHLVAAGAHRLHQERGEAFGSSWADRWLNKFLLNRIGSEMLMAQYVALAATGGAGIVEPSCDAGELCRIAAYEVQEMCAAHTGRTPVVEVEVRSATCGDGDVPRLSCVPRYLHYVLCEVLKNSCRATAAIARSARDLRARPISVIVCADERQVAIHIADQGGGIPTEVGQRVWSYLYTSAGEGVHFGERATSLSGFGVGLPLSRLYARYLGGSLELVNSPGYGATVHIVLPRLQCEQVEVVPDDDNPVPHG